MCTDFGIIVVMMMADVIRRTVLRITILDYTQDGPVNSENTKMRYM